MINKSTNIKERNKRFSFYKITLDTKRPRHMALEVQGPAWLVKDTKMCIHLTIFFCRNTRNKMEIDFQNAYLGIVFDNKNLHKNEYQIH